MKKIFLITALLINTVAFANTAEAKSNVCYGDQGVDISAPYVLTVKQPQMHQIDLITEDFLSNDTVGVLNVFNFEPAMIYILTVNPNTQVSDDVVTSNKAVDRAVRRAVTSVLRKYGIKASGFALECNGTVTGLPRAGGMN